jgi:hypothetical protein
LMHISVLDHCSRRRHAPSSQNSSASSSASVIVSALRCQPPWLVEAVRIRYPPPRQSSSRSHVGSAVVLQPKYFTNSSHTEAFRHFSAVTHAAVVASGSCLPYLTPHAPAPHPGVFKCARIGAQVRQNRRSSAPESALKSFRNRCSSAVATQRSSGSGIRTTIVR